MPAHNIWKQPLWEQLAETGLLWKLPEVAPRHCGNSKSRNNRSGWKTAVMGSLTTVHFSLKVEFQEHEILF